MCKCHIAIDVVKRDYRNENQGSKQGCSLTGLINEEVPSTNVVGPVRISTVHVSDAVGTDVVDHSPTEANIGVIGDGLTEGAQGGLQQGRRVKEGKGRQRKAKEMKGREATTNKKESKEYSGEGSRNSLAW